MNSRAEYLYRVLNMKMLPEEGTFYSEISKSEQKNAAGELLYSLMYGLYTDVPCSQSYFHQLEQEEIWQFYEGDPIELHLLQTDGSYQKIILGSEPSLGQTRSAVIAPYTHQAAALQAGGKYALYACMVVPAFNYRRFHLSNASELQAKYPQAADVIRKMTAAVQANSVPDLKLPGNKL